MVAFCYYHYHYSFSSICLSMSFFTVGLVSSLLHNHQPWITHPRSRLMESLLGPAFTFRFILCFPMKLVIIHGLLVLSIMIFSTFFSAWPVLLFPEPPIYSHMGAKLHNINSASLQGKWYLVSFSKWLNDYCFASHLLKQWILEK